MKRGNSKKFSMVIVVGLVVAITAGLICTASATGNNGWTVLGTGGNITFSANSTSSTTITFNDSYDWEKEQAQLENKLIPVGYSAFEFKFKVEDLSDEGWIAMAVCWATVPQGVLHANSVHFVIEAVNTGNMKIKRTQFRPEDEVIDVDIDPSDYNTIKIWTSGAETNHVAVNGTEVYVFDDIDFYGMATGASIHNLGLTLAVGGGADNAITIDTEVETVSETEADTKSNTSQDPGETSRQQGDTEETSVNQTEETSEDNDSPVDRRLVGIIIGLVIAAALLIFVLQYFKKKK